MRIKALLIVVAIFWGTSFVFAAVIYHADEYSWSAMVTGEEFYGTSSAEIEAVIGHTPVAEELLGSTINFDSIDTGITRSFRIKTLEINSEFVYSDDAGNTFFQDILSVGNVDEYQDDDWDLEITGGDPVYAIGFEVGNNDYNSGETVYVYGTDNSLLFSVTPPSEQALQFIGFISDDAPLGRISFDEDSGHDDIGITNFHFAIPEPATLLLLGLSGLALRRRNRA